MTLSRGLVAIASGQRLLQRAHDTVDVLIGQAGMEGEAQERAREAVRDGQVPGGSEGVAVASGSWAASV